MAGFGYRILGFGSGCAGPAYIEATGGDETITDGDIKIHIFTGDGTFCVTSKGRASGSNQADYMVVAGGGGGGQGTGGGGGGGGFRLSAGTLTGCYTVPAPLAGCVPGQAVTLGAMPISVGGGGVGRQPAGPVSGRGGNSVFGSITSTGGGGGNFGDGTPTGPTSGGPGGSGGGAGRLNNTVGNGNEPPVTPPQGNNGSTGPFNTGAGGGGAGNAASGKTAGNGSPSGIAPAPSTGSGDNRVYSGGGGGGSDQTGDPGGNGGPGGGGRGGNRQNSPVAGTAGTANTGGGGGGRGLPSSIGATGGSGVVVIRYKFQN